MMTTGGENYRAFESIDDSSEVVAEAVPVKIQNTLEVLRNEVVGSYQKFTSPYGEKPIIYTDWTASGRPVQRIEDYIQNEVMPYYGNTHTAASITGHQSTCFRHEARQIIAESVNAKVTGKAAEDVVIFTGNGTTAAVNKLVDALGLNIQPPAGNEETSRPVVFVSSYEHHSNLLPWRESSADVITIGYDPITGVDLTELEQQLQRHAHRVLRIGAFSACSNVTGICTAVDEVSILLHRYHAIAVFDYATAAPYVKVDMNPVLPGNPDSALAYKDAIFFSGHKFLGGPGCPGVLIAKRKLMPQSFETPSSASVGGGTVFYVTEEHHRYLSNREEREEGGTPYVLGDVKLGLVMHVKKAIRAAWVEQEEHRIAQLVQERLQRHPAVVLLGKPALDGAPSTSFLPIFSFLLRSGDKFLHFHFVAALLNDLFGIQCRGGCMCAGPFSQTLLGITDAHNAAFEQALLNRHEVLRPGYTRVSFPYWMHASEVDYVVDAIHFVASHGHKFLPSYRYNHMTGEWAHSTRLTRFPERIWLSRFTLDAPPAQAASSAGAVAPRTAAAALREWEAPTVEALLTRMKVAAQEELQKIDAQMKKIREKGTPAPAAVSGSTAATGESLHAFEHLRWFVSADEAQALHRAADGANVVSALVGPIRPVDLHGGVVDGQASNTAVAQTGDKLKVSAFAVQRDKKFLARTGREVLPPRYMTLLGRNLAAASDTLAADTISGKIRAAEASAEEDIAVPAPTPAPTPRTASGTVASPAPSAPPVPVQSPMETDDSAFTCENGTCSMRPRAAVAGADSDAPTATMDATGKILSGPGRTYLPTVTAPAAGPDGTKAKTKVPTHLPPKKIMKCVGQAIKDWNMIEEGDRLLLGLSGGKDSLALLHILLAVQKRAPVKFELACATVDPQTDSFDPSPLIPYVQSLGVTYHYLSEPIVELAKSKLQGDSLCAFCSRFKRGLLYSCCRTNGYNKLVLAQHLDDLVESFLMSALHNGQVRTMKANYTIEAGDVRVIRPLIYVREQATRDFSQSVKLPIINENCPACFEQPKERARMKKLMAQEETMVPNLFYNLKRALIPLMHDDTYAAMSAVAQLIEKTNLNPRNRTAPGAAALPPVTASSGSGAGSSNKRPSDDGSSGGAGATAVEAKRPKVLNGQDGNDSEDEEPSPAVSAQCGADGGYCPPCYELA